jgi:CDP-diacylglycerol--glycerol-3-phosphate 3-phosphatidyltransferase
VLDAKAREALRGISDATGRALAKVGFTANSLTALGVALSSVAAWRISRGAFLSAGLILTAGGLLDFCDGAVARVRGTASKFGAFLDSFTDRISDALVFSALIWWMFTDGGNIRSDHLLVLTFAAYGGAVLTSYVRAKAESLGFDCKVGILERAERLIVLCGGLIIGQYALAAAIWVIAILGLVTVVQRLLHVAKQARSQAA